MKINTENTGILSPKNQLQLFGYDDCFNSFIKLFHKNKLPNTILLSGLKGSGKATFAYHFINYLLSYREQNKYSVNNFTIAFSLFFVSDDTTISMNDLYIPLLLTLDSVPAINSPTNDIIVLALVLNDCMEIISVVILTNACKCVIDSVPVNVSPTFFIHAL